MFEITLGEHGNGERRVCVAHLLAAVEAWTVLPDTARPQMKIRTAPLANPAGLRSV